MLKKMRWRFIGAAMAAFSAVIIILVCAVDLWNYNISASRQDKTLEDIIRLETSSPDEFPDLEKGFHMPGPFGGRSREARYMTRFFVVYCGKDGSISGTNQDNIASVSAEDAKAYAENVLKKGRSRGYYKNYRYLLQDTDNGKIMVFLNSEREIQSVKTLLLVSGIIAFVSLLAVFALVFVFSKRAIAPYIRNIETQKQFITDAGHELKTPLTSISASADILAMEYADNEWVANIQKQTARMAKLVASLVKLSRLDEEQPFKEKAEFSLSEAIWEISEPIAAAAAAQNKEYTQSIEEGIVFCGDKNAVQQMVSALLDNAVKYSGDGGKISLSVCRRYKKIEIEIRNTCENADKIDTEKIFDRFYRYDKARENSDSFGIGLSAARAAADKHNGTIKARKLSSSEISFRITI